MLFLVSGCFLCFGVVKPVNWTERRTRRSSRFKERFAETVSSMSVLPRACFVYASVSTEKHGHYCKVTARETDSKYVFRERRYGALSSRQPVLLRSAVLCTAVSGGTGHQKRRPRRAPAEI